MDSLEQGSRVLIIDDVLATGGTAQAASILVERLDAQVVDVACLIEMPLLKGREKVKYAVAWGDDMDLDPYVLRDRLLE